MRLARVGEEVVCVDNALRRRQPKWKLGPLGWLRVGERYVVTDVRRDWRGRTFYRLEGDPLRPLDAGFYSDRFELAPKRTDWVEVFKKWALDAPVSPKVGDLVE